MALNESLEIEFVEKEIIQVDLVEKEVMQVGFVEKEVMQLDLVEKEIMQVGFVEKEIVEVELAVIDIIPRRKNITDLDDVNITDVVESEILVREGAYWVNKPLSTVTIDTVHNEEPVFVSDKIFHADQAYLLGSLEVFLNGIKEKYITQISDTHFELPIYDPTYDIIEISYIKK